MARMSLCIECVAAWMSSNRLRLNPSKTELIWLGTNRRLQHCDGFNMTVCGADVRPVDCVRDLGVLIDSNMTLSNHVNNVAGICFYQLRQLRIIRRSLTTNATHSWVWALIHTRIDYCYGLLAAGPKYLHAREVTVRPPCRRQTCSAAPTSFVCFRNYARTVALARDARSCPIQTVYPCIVVASRIQSHLLSNSLSSSFQSAYRMFHSTETTLLGIHNDLILAMDRGEVTSLILLDLSAAFDIVDHSILLHRLQHWFGLHGTSLDWFSSYLTSRSQAVSIQNSTSSFSNLSCGVPQGSVLGPLLFTLYTTPLGSVISKNSTKYHIYADDTQLYISSFLSLLQIQLLHLKYSLILSLTYSPG